MWGLVWRSVTAGLFTPLIAAFLSRVLTHMIDAATDGLQSTPDDPLYNSLTWVQQPENMILIGIVAIVFAFVAGSVVEGRMGV